MGTCVIAGDIAYIYARFCPEMDREAVRAMGQTDAPPFMECADSHWASLSGWTEDSAADLGDDAEFGGGDEALSDDEGDWRYWWCDPRFGLVSALALGTSCPSAPPPRR